MEWRDGTEVIFVESRIERPEPVLHRFSDVVAAAHGQGEREADVGEQ